MICHMGGYPTIRHEIRDLTTNLLTEVCHNVSCEPVLQPLSSETFQHRSAIRDDNARLDIRASGFWSHSQEAFFDVRVFYPIASSNCSPTISSAYRKHESVKKRQYGQRVREVERGVFTPLVFTTSGGMAKECSTFYKRLASMLALKSNQPYSSTIGWLRCRIQFALLRMSIMCIRGSRSSRGQPLLSITSPDLIPLATSEGQIYN